MSQRVTPNARERWQTSNSALAARSAGSTFDFRQALAVLVHEEHGLDAALIFLQQLYLIGGRCRKLEVVVLHAHLPQAELDAVGRATPARMRFHDGHVLVGDRVFEFCVLVTNQLLKVVSAFFSMVLGAKNAASPESSASTR